MDEVLIQQYPEIEQSHFWWVSRRELVQRLIRARSTGHRVSILDVGCGGGVMAQELSDLGAAVTGVDVVSHEGWTTSGSDGPDLKEGDYMEMAADLGEYDWVLALDVMEHIEDESRFVDLLKGNLRPGGSLVLTVPAYRWLWSNHDVVNHHFRRYTRSSLSAALEAGGLQVTRCGYIFIALVPPALLAKRFERIRGERGVTTPSEGLNRAALAYFRWEHRLAARRHDFLPAGTSAIAVCRAD